jgi:hypothetical protein
LHPNEVRKRLSFVLSRGFYVIWKHCQQELAKDNLDDMDAVNVLRGGRVTEPGELVKGQWRYRVHTDRMCVVVQFESDQAISVVTAWRKQK